MQPRAPKNTSAQSSVSNLCAYDNWLENMGISAATGWRWRRDGLITTVNILGRIYIAREVIDSFERRAAAGEFAKVHFTPRRKRVTSAVQPLQP